MSCECLLFTSKDEDTLLVKDDNSLDRAEDLARKGARIRISWKIRSHLPEDKVLKLLEKHDAVDYLNLSYSTKEFHARILKQLPQFPSLRHLTVCPRGDLVHLAITLPQSSITSLSLTGNGDYPREEMLHLEQALTGSKVDSLSTTARFEWTPSLLSSSSQLRKLRIFSHDFARDVAELVKRLPSMHLTHLTLERAYYTVFGDRPRLKHEDALKLIDALPNTLECLVLEPWMGGEKPLVLRRLTRLSKLRNFKLDQTAFDVERTRTQVLCRLLFQKRLKPDVIRALAMVV